VTNWQLDELALPAELDRRDADDHGEVALRSTGRADSLASRFEFIDDSYVRWRLFSDLLGILFLVIVLGDWTSWWLYLLGPVAGGIITLSIAYALIHRQNNGRGRIRQNALDGFLEHRPGCVSRSPSLAT
jgi:hypothetical protein